MAPSFFVCVFYLRIPKNFPLFPEARVPFNLTSLQLQSQLEQNYIATEDRVVEQSQLWQLTLD